MNTRSWNEKKQEHWQRRRKKKEWKALRSENRKWKEYGLSSDVAEFDEDDDSFVITETHQPFTECTCAMCHRCQLVQSARWWLVIRSSFPARLVETFVGIYMHFREHCYQVRSHVLSLGMNRCRGCDDEGPACAYCSQFFEEEDTFVPDDADSNRITVQRKHPWPLTGFVLFDANPRIPVPVHPRSVRVPKGPEGPFQLLSSVQLDNSFRAPASSTIVNWCTGTVVCSSYYRGVRGYCFKTGILRWNFRYVLTAIANGPETPFFFGLVAQDPCTVHIVSLYKMCAKTGVMVAECPLPPRTSDDCPCLAVSRSLVATCCDASAIRFYDTGTLTPVRMLRIGRPVRYPNTISLHAQNMTFTTDGRHIAMMIFFSGVWQAAMIIKLDVRTGDCVEAWHSLRLWGKTFSRMILPTADGGFAFAHGVMSEVNGWTSDPVLQTAVDFDPSSGNVIQYDPETRILNVYCSLALRKVWMWGCVWRTKRK